MSIIYKIDTHHFIQAGMVLILSNLKQGVMKNLIIIFICLLQFTFVKAQILENLDEIAPFHEELAAIRKDKQWAFINKSGEIVIDYRDDIVSSVIENESDVVTGKLMSYPRFQEGKCLFRKLDGDGIYHYGYIDTGGREVIAPGFVNATNFQNGKAIVVKFEIIPIGSNQLLEKNVVSYRLEEFVIDNNGNIIMTLFNFRKTVPKKIKGEEPPTIHSKFVGPNLVADQLENGKWEIHTFNPK